VAVADRRQRSARRHSPPHDCARAHAATDEAAPTNGDSAGGSDVIAASLLTLPERQRLVLFLRYYADLDYATIAAVAGIAPGTVAATLNAAHRALRVRLQEVTR
jgi:RNA polymerase sigma factor (sigma-70 family)